jgi:acid phosphatase family membrane protein YuiD
MISSINVIFALIVSLGAGLVAQLLKIFWIKEKNLLKILTITGGMPSTHSAILISFTLIIYFLEGITTTFALAVLMSLIIVRDAVGVRYAVGQNAIILKKMNSKNKPLADKVVLTKGHTIKEVSVGGLIGVIVSIITYLLILRLF